MFAGGIGIRQLGTGTSLNVLKPESTAPMEEKNMRSELTVDSVRRRFPYLQRIAIIGPSGSGKSTLARELASFRDLPVFHLDRTYWKPGWVESTKEEFREAQSQIVAGQRWIVDGNYGSTFDLRMPRADLVIYLDFPRRIYFRRVILRTLRGLGRTRPDLAENCPERFDFEFYRFVWNIPRNSRPRTLAALERYEVAPKMLRLESPRAVRNFLNSLTFR